jgi:hypothetical protein
MMASSTDTKRLADRILKLLALASSSQFAAEAATAKAMADDLMRTHNISLDTSKPPQDTIEIRSYTPFAKGMKWEGIIVDAIADLTSCSFFFSNRLDHYTLVGSIWNLDILEYMLHEIHRQRIVAWLAYKGQGGPDSFNKFCFGYARALETKIASLVNAGQVIAKTAELRHWYEDNILGKKTTLSGALHAGRASSAAGMAAGGDASLHRGALGQAARQIGYRGKP